MVILGFSFYGFYFIESTDRCEHWYRAKSLSSVPWESYDVIDGLTPGKHYDSGNHDSGNCGWQNATWESIAIIPGNRRAPRSSNSYVTNLQALKKSWDFVSWHSWVAPMDGKTVHVTRRAPVRTGWDKTSVRWWGPWSSMESSICFS